MNDQQGGLRLKDSVEAFLRFTDKPMIASKDAVTTGLAQACADRLVGIGRGAAFAALLSRHCGEPVSLDPTEDGVWIIPPFAPEPTEPLNDGDDGASTGSGGRIAESPTSAGTATGTAKPASANIPQPNARSNVSLSGARSRSRAGGTLSLLRRPGRAHEPEATRARRTIRDRAPGRRGTERKRSSAQDDEGSCETARTDDPVQRMRSTRPCIVDLSVEQELESRRNRGDLRQQHCR